MESLRAVKQRLCALRDAGELEARRAAAGCKSGRPSLTTASHSTPWAIWRLGAHLSTRKASEAPWAPPLMPAGPLRGALNSRIPHLQPTGALLRKARALTSSLLASLSHAIKLQKGASSMVKAPSWAGQSAPSQPPHMGSLGSWLLYTLWRSHAATQLAHRG